MGKKEMKVEEGRGKGRMGERGVTEQQREG